VPTIHNEGLERRWARFALPTLQSPRVAIPGREEDRTVICPTMQIGCAILAFISREAASAACKNACGEKLNSADRSSRSGHRAPGSRKFLFTKIRNRVYLTTSRLDRRGVRVVTDVGAGGDGRERITGRVMTGADGEIVWS
jgi:hypothetical protein